ncbi:YjjG family noncanonical pyrimidine nucleotidase [Psychrilyobacter atlanticus]|uniref:YjjG family noncanonical pyrimidine nucleotidase n=1 Tax=Psychrilyobacter atlanticus TaxID=271091 RepID=UPI000409D5F7|nr:YjjG family noncanonical pyrimidine nucleotidase [Psychrilyobacter atlanticus]
MKFRNEEGSMKYKVILFDADETLFDFKRAEDYALEESLKKIGIGYNKEHHLSLYEEVNGRIWHELDEGKIEIGVLKVERFRRYFERLGIVYDAAEFADLYMTELGNGSFVLNGAIEMLEKLKDKIRLAIITNGLTKVQDNRIKKSIISHYFEEIVVSETIGISKPNSSIFEYTMKKMNHLDRDDVIMVGDNLSSDILGGINYGIDTCWYNPKNKESRDDIKPTYEVSNFKEMLEMLISGNTGS